MYKIHKYLLLFFILIFFSGFSQTKYSNEFLKIGAGARSLSLSKAVVCSSPNASAGYWNPSSLVDITESEIELMHASYFAGIANFDQLSYAKKVNESPILSLFPNAHKTYLKFNLSSTVIYLS